MTNSRICFNSLVRGLWMVAVIFTLTSIAIQEPPVAAASLPFTINVSPAIETVTAGQSVHFTVNVRSTSSHHVKVSFHCANKIAETACSFSPSTVTATATSGTSTLTLAVSSSATVGTHHFTVRAASGSTTENRSVELTIQAPPHISVTVAPSSEKVQVGDTHNFTATVHNDSQKKGVKWTLTGAGTLSATSSASGQPVAYTAPSSVPSPATVTLTATSNADGTKSASATITVTFVQPTDLGAIQGAALLIAVDVDNAIDIASVEAANLVQLQRSVDGGKTFDRISTNVPGGANTPVGVQMGLDHHGNVSLFWELWQTAVIYVRVFTPSSGFGELLPIGAAASCGLDPCAQDPGQYPQLSVTPSGIINVAFSGGVQQDEVQSVHLVPPLSPNGNVYASCSSSPNECDSIAANFNAGNVTNVAGPQDQEYLFWNNAVAPGAGGTLFGTGVFFTGSLDGGKTFPNANNPITVSSTDDNATTTDSKPQAEVDRNGNIDVAWSNTVILPNGSPNYHVMFSRSTDQGQTFSTPVVVLTGREFFSLDQFTFIVEPSGAIDFGIDVAPASGGFLQFLRSTDNGATFSSPVELSSSAVARPAIAVDSCDDINVAWDDIEGNIFLARSTDGSIFSSPVNLTNSGSSGSPHMAADTLGHTYVIWPQTLVDGTTHGFFALARTCAE